MLFVYFGNTCGRKSVKIHVMLFKYQKLLLKTPYQTALLYSSRISVFCQQNKNLITLLALKSQTLAAPLPLELPLDYSLAPIASTIVVFISLYKFNSSFSLLKLIYWQLVYGKLFNYVFFFFFIDCCHWYIGTCK